LCEWSCGICAWTGTDEPIALYTVNVLSRKTVDSKRDQDFEKGFLFTVMNCPLFAKVRILHSSTPEMEEQRGSRNDRERDRDGDRYRERHRERDRERRRRDDRDDREPHQPRQHPRQRNSPSHRDRIKREDDSPSPRPHDRRQGSHPRRQRSQSPYSKRQRIKRELSPSPRHSRSPSPWGQHQHDLAHDRAHPPRPPSPSPKEKQKPNYGLSGLLAAATNMKNGTVLKYHEPPEAKKGRGWRIFVYKNGKEVDNFGLDSQSNFLIGKDRNVNSPFPFSFLATLIVS